MVRITVTASHARYQEIDLAASDAVFTGAGAVHR